MRTAGARPDELQVADVRETEQLATVALHAPEIPRASYAECVVRSGTEQHSALPALIGRHRSMASLPALAAQRRAR